MRSGRALPAGRALEPAEAFEPANSSLPRILRRTADANLVRCQGRFFRRNSDRPNLLRTCCTCRSDPSCPRRRTCPDTSRRAHCTAHFGRTNCFPRRRPVHLQGAPCMRERRMPCDCHIHNDAHLGESKFDLSPHRACLIADSKAAQSCRRRASHDIAQLHENSSTEASQNKS